MEIYNRLREVPEEAKRTISAGKLKGFTDINPMWRLKMLTEVFGPSGQGWKIEIADRWVEAVGNQACVQMIVYLYVKYDGVNWSDPVVGIGGSMLYGKGTGDAVNDEAFKMAYTDAISVACKSLGMAADVYYVKDRTKYEAQAAAQKAEADKQIFLDEISKINSVNELNEWWTKRLPEMPKSAVKDIRDAASKRATVIREAQA